VPVKLCFYLVTQIFSVIEGEEEEEEEDNPAISGNQS
jgi:hypothetical protein